MGASDPSKPGLENLLTATRQFLAARQGGCSVEILNGLVHDLRISLHQILLGHFLPLSREEGGEFQAALMDQLVNLCMEFNGSADHSAEYHGYCIGQMMACFQWAEQIKLEIPEDPVIQKMLAIDIPILRPFDYGIKKIKVHKGPGHKGPAK